MPRSRHGLVLVGEGDGLAEGEPEGDGDEERVGDGLPVGLVRVGVGPADGSGLDLPGFPWPALLPVARGPDADLGPASARCPAGRRGWGPALLTGAAATGSGPTARSEVTGSPRLTDTVTSSAYRIAPLTR